jgi:hypothetical protein
MRTAPLRLLILPAIMALCLASGCGQRQEEAATVKKAAEAPEGEAIPQIVMDGLEAKFPGAQIEKWTKEMEGDITVYDIEFRQEGLKLEADIKEDGTIHNWEKALDTEALPKAVKKAAMMRYPGASVKEVMEVTAVTDGQDELEGYEIVLETADMKQVEITVAPDGTIIEEPGQGGQGTE